MKQIGAIRGTMALDPDRTRVLSRPFRRMSGQRSLTISARFTALPESQFHTGWEQIRAEFADHQLKIDEFLRRRFDRQEPTV